jgi:hypothetical protein
MPSLQRADDRFGTPLTVLEGGSGQFTGVITEPNQGEVPAYLFNLPRRLLRVSASLPVKPGMVVRGTGGTVWMLGEHGDAETNQGIIFRSLVMFEATQQFTWQKRSKVKDKITGLDKDAGLVAQPSIWGCYEPSPEMFDRQLHSNFETARLITTADVQRDDVVNGMKVNRVDVQLGVRIVTLG